MIIRHKTRSVCAAAMAFLLTIMGSSASAQQPKFEPLELKFAQIERTIIDLSGEQQALTQQIGGNTQTIGELQSKNKLSFFERQRLEKLLQQSQELGEQVTALNVQIQDAKDRLVKIGMELASAYDVEINTLLSALEANVSAPKNQATFKRAEHLRSLRNQVRQKIGMESLEKIEITKLSISDDDSPKKIKQKADLLKDQEEKLRRRSNELHSKKSELKKELDLRIRMEDLVTDLALFDQQEEAIANFGDGDRVGDAALVEGSGDEASRTQVRTLQESALVRQRDFDYSSLSLDELEAVIDELEQEQLRTKIRADSLSEQAKAFYETAEELKKQ